MPLTSKGTEIMSAMQKQYGEEKGKEVFYASKNAGKISGVDDWRGDADVPSWSIEGAIGTKLDSALGKLDEIGAARASG